MGRWLLSLSCATGVIIAFTAAGGATEFHVALNGKDSNAGTRLATLWAVERAKGAVRALRAGRELPQGGVTVWLHRGEYVRASSFELDRADSGEPDRPIVYRALPGAEVRLVGGGILPAKAFQPVTAPDVLQRLDPAARQQVLGADLRALGITNYGTFPDQFSGAATVNWSGNV